MNSTKHDTVIRYPKVDVDERLHAQAKRASPAKAFRRFVTSLIEGYLADVDHDVKRGAGAASSKDD